MTKILGGRPAGRPGISKKQAGRPAYGPAGPPAAGQPVAGRPAGWPAAGDKPAGLSMTNLSQQILQIAGVIKGPTRVKI